MPKFDESILRPIRSVAKDYTIYKYDNGYMISIYVTDASENRRTLEITCDTIDDVMQYVSSIDIMAVDR